MTTALSNIETKSSLQPSPNLLASAGVTNRFRRWFFVLALIALTSAFSTKVQAQAFNIASFAAFPASPPNPTVFAVNITFNSVAPILSLTLFMRAPDNLIYPYNVPIPNGGNPVGPNQWQVTSVAVGNPNTLNGTYTLASIIALNAQNQNLNITPPTTAVPNFSYVVAPTPPFTLTSYSQTQFALNGPNSVSVSATLSFTFSTISALSSSCSITFQGPNGVTVPVPIFQLSFDSTAKTATARGFLNLNNDARANGNYTATSLSCANTNTPTAQTISLTAASFPGGAPAALFDSHCSLPTAPIPAGTVDVSAPVLTCTAFIPPTVDASLADSEVRVGFAFTENLSGFSYINAATLTSPSGNVYGYNSDDPSVLGLLAGNTSIGFAIPRYAPAGTYKLSITTADMVGNTHKYSSQDLANLGFPSTLNVTSANGGDTTPPTISSLSFFPDHIDTSSASATFTIQFAVQDAASGFADGSIAMPFNNGSLSYIHQIDLFQSTLISGSVNNGVFQATATLPKHNPAGVFTISSVFLADNAGNLVTLTQPQLPATLTVTSSTPDLQRPKLVYFDFSPKSINTSASSQTITYTSTWSDDISGFSSGHVPNISLLSPSGGQIVSISTCTVISSGNAFDINPRNVVYSCTVTVPKYAEAGTWTVSGLGIADGINFGPGPFGSNLTTSDIAALGFPTKFFNIQAAASPDGFIGPAGGSVTAAANSLLTLSAPAAIFPVVTGISMLNGINTSNLPIPQGFSGPGTNLVTFSLSPTPAATFPAPGVTLTVPTSSPLPANTNFVLYRLDPNSGALTPAPSVFGGNVTGTVNAAGTQATFTGIGTIATFVGFRRNTEVIGDSNGDNVIDCLDVAIIKAALGKRAGQAGYDARADINRDGVVDVRDLATVTRLLPAGTVCP